MYVSKTRLIEANKTERNWIAARSPDRSVHEHRGGHMWHKQDFERSGKAPMITCAHSSKAFST